MRHFRRCNQGTTLIEFAFVSFALFMLMMGIIEFGLIFFAMSVLEGSTTVGSRIGKTGYYTGLSREDYIRGRVSDLSAGYLDPTKLTIEILSYNSFDKVGQPEDFNDTNRNGSYDAGEGFTDVNGNGTWDADQGASGAGRSGAIVLYKVTYPWYVFTPLIGRFIGDENGKLNLSAISTVRNEPDI